MYRNFLFIFNVLLLIMSLIVPASYIESQWFMYAFIIYIVCLVYISSIFGGERILKQFTCSSQFVQNVIINSKIACTNSPQRTPSQSPWNIQQNQASDVMHTEKQEISCIWINQHSSFNLLRERCFCYCYWEALKFLNQPFIFRGHYLVLCISSLEIPHKEKVETVLNLGFWNSTASNMG